MSSSIIVVTVMYSEGLITALEPVALMIHTIIVSLLSIMRSLIQVIIIFIPVYSDGIVRSTDQVIKSVPLVAVPA